MRGDGKNPSQGEEVKRVDDGDYSASAGNGSASSPRTRVLIRPIVLSFIMASCIVTKAPVSQGKELSILARRN